MFLAEFTQICLQCCTVQSTRQRMGIHSAHSVSQNRRKTKWGWDIIFSYPYSLTCLNLGHRKLPYYYRCCFQISLFSLSSVCIIRKSRLSSSSVKPCSWIAFPRRLIGVFKVSPQSCHHLYNYEILSPEQFQKITWPEILGEILHSIAAYLAKRDVVQHTNN